MQYIIHDTWKEKGEADFDVGMECPVGGHSWLESYTRILRFRRKINCHIILQVHNFEDVTVNHIVSFNYSFLS